MSDLETNQAIELIKQGNIAEGAKILSVVLKNQPDNELAWLWMSACVPDQEKKIYCLQKVYQLNPFNPAAKKGLESLGIQVEPLISEEMEEPGSMPSIDNANFSYRDLTDALGERAPVNKEREPEQTASPSVSEPVETESAEPTFTFDEIARLEPETFGDTQGFEPSAIIEDRLPEPEPIEPPTDYSPNKAMMLEDFGFPTTDDLPPIAPSVPVPVVAPPQPVVSEPISESPRRRPRRRTNWLIIIILLLLGLLLTLLVVGRYVFQLF